MFINPSKYRIFWAAQRQGQTFLHIWLKPSEDSIFSCSSQHRSLQTTDTIEMP